MSIRMFSAFLMTAALILPGNAGRSAQWKGMMKTVDGVTVVENPKAPAEKAPILTLETELRLGEDEDRPDYLFGQIRSFAVGPDGRIYVSDDKIKTVKAFDRDGRFIRTIGAAGQGPGEYGRPYDVFVTENSEVIVTDGARRLVHIYGADGRHRESLSLGSIFPMASQRDDRGNFIVQTMAQWSLEGGGYAGYFEILRLNSRLEKLSSLTKIDISNSAKSAEFDRLPLFAGRPDGGFVFGWTRDYAFKYFDPAGRLIRAMSKKYDPIPVSQADVEAYKKSNIKIDVPIPKSYPAFRSFFLDEAGRLYVRTPERDLSGAAFIHDVFDPEGRYVGRLAVRGQPPFLMTKDRFYCVDEDADGNPFIRRDRIIWKKR
jgi:hypothetical protein